MSEFTIKDRVLNMYLTMYYTMLLYKVSECLLRDKDIQNLVKDLRWSTLEK